MQAFAYSLPLKYQTVIGNITGYGHDSKWSFAVSTAMDHGSMDELLAITPIIVSMQEYFHELLLEREAHPSHDWISELVKLKQPYQLSQEDLFSNCIFLLLSAHETMQLSLRLGLMNLLKHPEQYRLLQIILILSLLPLKKYCDMTLPRIK